MPDSMPPFTLSSIFGSEPSSVPNAVAVKAAAAITAMHIVSVRQKSHAGDEPDVQIRDGDAGERQHPAGGQRQSSASSRG